MEKSPNIIFFSVKLKFRSLIAKSEFSKTRQKQNKIIRYNFVLELKINLSSISPMIKKIDDMIINEMFSLNVNKFSFEPKK